LTFISGTVGVGSPSDSSTSCPIESEDGRAIEIEERLECADERPVYTESKSLEERARYVFILSSVMVLGDAGPSSKGETTLYKAIGGSTPKSCKATFSDRQMKL